jgi:DNA polymerase V
VYREIYFNFPGTYKLSGEQLFALSWGVDRSDLAENIVTKNKSYSNSQVLPRDYHKCEEIETVIREMAD